MAEERSSICPLCSDVGWVPQDHPAGEVSWYQREPQLLQTKGIVWRRCACSLEKPAPEISASLLRTMGRKTVEIIDKWDIRAIDLSVLGPPRFERRGPQEIQLRHTDRFLLITSPSVLTGHLWEVYPFNARHKRFTTYDEASDFIVTRLGIPPLPLKEFEPYIYF